MPSERPDKLIAAYLEGELDEGQAVELSAWVTASRENARYLSALVTVERGLVLHCRKQTAGNIIAEVGADEAGVDPVWDMVVDQALSERRKHEVEELANRRLAESQAADSKTNRLMRLRIQDAHASEARRVAVIPKGLLWLAAAAAIGLAVWAGVSMKTATQPRQQTSSGDPSRSPSAVELPTGVAMVRGELDARWVGHGDPNGHLIENQRLTLTDGFAEIVFGSGVSVIVEAPATFVCVGPNGIRLERGKVAAVVPPSGTGFTVSTPAGVVTDYGTEFGVAVEPDGRTTTHVYEGVVSYVPASESPDSAGAHRLLAGDAIQGTTDGSVLTADADPLAFVRSEEFDAIQHGMHSAYSRWQAYSYGLRRDTSVLAFFVPDNTSVVSRQLSNLAPGAPGATLAGPVLAPGRFPGKSALHFSSNQDVCRFTERTETADLTLAAWVWIDDLTATPVMLMGTEFWETPGATHWQIEAAGDGRGWGMSLGSLDQAGGAETKAISSVILSQDDWDRWVHFAVVADAATGQARFYVDGAVRDVQPYRAIVPHVLGNARIGTLRGEDGRSTAPHDRHLDGRIDEMVILSRPMSDGDVRAMYNAGRPAGGRSGDD